MTKSSLAIENIHLWYDQFHALRGINLSLEQGQFLALLGPSGCGKTSLLRSIAGFTHPQNGSIMISGKNVVSLKPRERNLGMVFQQYALFPHMSAAENVAFGLKCRKRSRSDIEERVKNTLEMVGLSHLADRMPRQLSGGQQQRVALARSLIIEPDVLLLDEPLGALDKKLRIQMQTELKAIQQRLNVTAIFVTHDQEEAMAMADTIAIMREGEIEQIGSPAEIFSAPETVWAANFVGSGNVLNGKLIANGHGEFKIQGLKGCEFSLLSSSKNICPDNPVFVSAENVDFSLTNDDDALVVASHRYLGVFVEVWAEAAGTRILSLMSPKKASRLVPGTRVRATAKPSELRLIGRTIN